MRVELTIRTAAAACDVAVEAPALTPIGVVHERLLELLGLDRATVLTHRGRPLDLSAPLSGGLLRTGTVLGAGIDESPSPAPAGLALRVIGGPCAGSIIPLRRGRITLGRDPHNDVVLADDRVSRRHAAIEVGPGGVTIADQRSTNGTAINGISAPGSVRVIGGADLVRVGDSLLAVGSTTLVPAAVVPTPEAVLVNRAPRRRMPADGAREVASAPEPVRTRPRSVQWASALIPAVAAGALAYFTRSPIFLLFGLMSPIMVLSGAIGDRLHWRRSRRQHAAADLGRRSIARTELADALRDETVARCESAPDPATLLTIATTPASRLWERRSHDHDLLTVRLGLAELASTTVVRDGSTRRPAGRLHDVPAVVDLRSGPLGVVGPPPVAAALLRWLIGQLAVQHAPSVLDLAFLLSREIETEWAWAGWLPHVAGQVAVGPDEGQLLVADLTRRADRRRGALGTGPSAIEHWTVVVMAAGHADVGAGVGALLAGGPAGGVTAICVAPRRSMLPTMCATVAHVDDDVGARLTLHRAGVDEHIGRVIVDACGPVWAEQVSRALAPLAEARSTGPRPLPATCPLSAALGGGEITAAAITRAWAASNGRPDTVLGAGADGAVVVDLLRDGPHALVAGTTGSGKSQLLQTLVIGLALRHPPDEINFLLVDYKGGAAFAECDHLPHTAGVVTDLDPHLTRRALRALQAEVARRERLLAAARVDDLEAYRATRPSVPLARLVIVVDEFATLAAELPEFLPGVVGVARRGRSLGVHLVLATQRPGHAVTPEIRANTSLRIALRVTDASESTDLIQSAEAVLIPRDRPGRAVLRSGDRLVAFQTARPVSSTAADIVVERLGPWRRARAAEPAEDGLRHIVEVISDAACSSGRPSAPSPWRDPLPDSVVHTALADPTAGDQLALALVDQPDTQTRTTLTIDLGRPGGVLIAGGSGSGRTTALVTLALAGASTRGPGALAIHLIDAADRLRAVCGGLPHIGTVVSAGDPSLAAALLRRLATRPRSTGPVLLLIDGWDRMVADCDDADAAHLTDRLTALLRSARESLVTVVATGDRSLLMPRSAAPFDTRLVLHLADRADYGLIGLGRGDVPIRMPPGRGVRSSDGAEFQIAHAGTEPDALEAAVRAVRATWIGHPPDPDVLRLRPLPRLVPIGVLPRTDDRLALGLGGPTAVPVSFDPFSGPRRWLVAGPARSGRTTTLLTILAEALRVGLDVVVAAPPRSPLAVAAAAASVRTIRPDETVVALGLDTPTVLLVDDSEAFADSPAGDQLAAWARSDPPELAVVLAGRCDDLVTTYRGIAAEVRRSRCGILLQPGPVDGELLGLRLPRRRANAEPAGRGVIVGDPAWESDDGEPTPIQVAHP